MEFLQFERPSHVSGTIDMYFRDTGLLGVDEKTTKQNKFNTFLLTRGMSEAFLLARMLFEYDENFPM